MELKERNTKFKFGRLVNNNKPKPKLLKNCIYAFVVGGIICDIGQIISNYLTSTGLKNDEVSAYTSIIMIFLGALLTGLGVYDKIANFAGAGTVVPIIGFSNSIVAPAMEFKKEGYVFGVGAKMFTIAGPVLVYGITTSVAIGILHYFTK